MKRLLLLAALVLSSLPAVAGAQVDVQIQLGLPAMPQLVVIEPGVRVVENYEEEVFYTRGWYWVRRGPHWYRARRPHSHFAYVHERHVPARLVHVPPGHYRHWHRHQPKHDRHAWRRQHAPPPAAVHHPPPPRQHAPPPAAVHPGPPPRHPGPARPEHGRGHGHDRD